MQSFIVNNIQHLLSLANAEWLQVYMTNSDSANSLFDRRWDGDIVDCYNLPVDLGHMMQWQLLKPDSASSRVSGILKTEGRHAAQQPQFQICSPVSAEDREWYKHVKIN